MEDVNTECPYKFTDLHWEIMMMTTPGTDPAIDKYNAYVFDTIIPIMGWQVGAGVIVTYPSGNSYAHKLVKKDEEEHCVLAFTLLVTGMRV